MLCPSLYHRVTSHVPSGGNRSAILTGNHAGTLSSGCQHGSNSRELLTYLANTIKSLIFAFQQSYRRTPTTE